MRGSALDRSHHLWKWARRAHARLSDPPAGGLGGFGGNKRPLQPPLLKTTYSGDEVSRDTAFNPPVIMRLSLALLMVLCLSLVSGVPSAGPSPAEAHHRPDCQNKHKECGAAPAPAPEPEPEPAPEPVPTLAPVLQPITVWRVPGSAPLSDGEAAARVSPAVETRPENAAANSYRPSAAEIQTFLTGQRDPYGRLPAEYNPALAKVTGDFVGTTDEILQWAAHKWGIPEDLARAVAVTESWWRQDGYGDRRTVSDPTLYPVQSRISGTSDVYESLGLMQIKWRPDGSVGTGTEPLRWKSTAFNADFWAASVRYYYDGACYWCGATYSAGQEQLSIGAWYSPYPWGNSGQQGYATKVWDHAAKRTWAQPGF